MSWSSVIGSLFWGFLIRANKNKTVSRVKQTSKRLVAGMVTLCDVAHL